MTKPSAKVDAFQLALMRSERLRILIVIAVVVTILAVRTLRGLFAPSNDGLAPILEAAVFGAIFIGIELLMLRDVHRAIKGGPQLPRYAWLGSIVLESCLPAFALAFLTDDAILLPYRALAHPAVLWFFVLIILSTLHLNPNNCRLSGVVAAGSYLAAAYYLGWRPTMNSGVSVFAPERTVVSYAFAYLIGGFVAGAVAGEIRKHVNAALREAEVRRELDRLAHDLQVARNIQQSLLPNSVPEVAGFEIAGWNQPADETGGDFYDWQPLSSGKFLVVLADVTGHGIGSALLAAVCRAYARSSFSMEENLLPAMERINTQLASDLSSGLFVTFVAAICEAGSPRVKLLSAGHGPLFFYLLREDRFDQKGAQALPLGITSSFQSEPELNIDLHPGDMIVLTTDGFFEWANAADERFGTERMQEAIRSARHLPPAEIISSLYHAVLEFSAGSKQQDDLTAVIIKRTSLPA